MRRVTIEECGLQVSACCRSPFLVRNKTEGEVCGACRQPWRGITPWYSEDGTMQFELISELNPGVGITVGPCPTCGTTHGVQQAQTEDHCSSIYHLNFGP